MFLAEGVKIKNFLSFLKVILFSTCFKPETRSSGTVAFLQEHKLNQVFKKHHKSGADTGYLRSKTLIACSGLVLEINMDMDLPVISLGMIKTQCPVF